MVSNKIYVAGTDISSLEEEYVLDALKNGWYENKYYYCERLQKEFSEYHDRKYALMTVNCTSALHLILASLGVGPEDEVIVPECTWIASAAPITYLGAKPVFCDIQKDTWCIDPKSVEKAITKKTKAVIAVDLFGNMPDMQTLKELCDSYNIFLIEDAAEALGSKISNTKAGKFGIASTFSFHNTKTMSTGEGGMLLLDDDRLYEKCVKLRDHGRSPETKPYYNDIVGYKYMPFNLQAALGLAQFHRIEELIAIKKKHLKFYKESLSDLKLTFNFESEEITNGAWITAMVIDPVYKIGKQEMLTKLEKKGIPARPLFYPLSSIPAFNLENEYKEKNPVSYDISSRAINLPGAPNMTEENLTEVCKAVREILNDQTV